MCYGHEIVEELMYGLWILKVQKFVVIKSKFFEKERSESQEI